uniref:Uncharacterized protein n=1 Tax=Picea glauca TaxID=3330 RepID=A0A101M192_PICGL|nr:hypothetical protein ABT39_MTgene3658 [Picea glauca]
MMRSYGAVFSLINTMRSYNTIYYAMQRQVKLLNSRKKSHFNYAQTVWVSPVPQLVGAVTQAVTQQGSVQ